MRPSRGRGPSPSGAISCWAVKRIAIRVPQQPYAALIGRDLLRDVGSHMVRALGRRPSSAFIITTPKVRRHWAGSVQASLRKAKVRNRVLLMQDGESHKTLATVEKLSRGLVQAGADRDSVLIALGGGMVGDVAGLVAALYMRGIPVVQAPTTLLAQVDAAIGGKTAVNLAEGKNLVGAFHQPSLVVADAATLASLPQREYRAGLYEALKCGVVRDGRIFKFMAENRSKLLARDAKALEWLITACVAVKAAVVAADEREQGLRRILNFGHTIGHALEAEEGYRHMLHGEAVAWGMMAASLIAVEMGACQAATAARIIATILSFGPLPVVRAQPMRVVRRLRADKKTCNGTTHFVLPVRIGEVATTYQVPPQLVVQAVEELRAVSRHLGRR